MRYSFNLFQYIRKSSKKFKELFYPFPHFISKKYIYYYGNRVVPLLSTKEKNKRIIHIMSY